MKTERPEQSGAAAGGQTEAAHRRRLLLFLTIALGVSLVVVVLGWATQVQAGGRTYPKISPFLNPGVAWDDRERAIAKTSDVLRLSLYIVALLAAWARPLSARGVLHLASLVLVLEGLVLTAQDAAGVQGGPWILGLMIPHVIAALALHWSPLQAALPIGVLALVSLGVCLLFRGQLLSSTDGRLEALGHVAATLIAGAPGTLLATLRDSRSRIDFLQRSYGEVRRELTNARKIHESLFPARKSGGAVRLWYEYEPMRLIGGDYLFASIDAHGKEGGERLSVIVLDVTGHGVPAALTVNRIYGELQRLFAEHPDIAPGNVLRLLNRYVHLTLSGHSVFATALCMRINTAAGTLEYANGGHPPAFLKSQDGKVEELDSTATVLGACGDKDFEMTPRVLPFRAGDTIIAYTDGAIESRNGAGKYLGVDGLRGLILSTPTHVSRAARRSFSARPLDEEGGQLARTLLRAVAQYRAGAPHDDTLIVEISRHAEEHAAPSASA